MWHLKEVMCKCRYTKIQNKIYFNLYLPVILTQSSDYSLNNHPLNRLQFNWIILYIKYKNRYQKCIYIKPIIIHDIKKNSIWHFYARIYISWS